MASTRFRFGMTSKEFFVVAKSYGFKLAKQSTGKRWRVKVMHSKLTEAKTFETRKHGEACGPMVSFAIACTKQLLQMERAAQHEKEAVKAAVSQQEEKVAMHGVPGLSFEQEVKHAVEMLVLWLDDQKQAGLQQFSITQLNNKRRKELGLPGSEAVKAALDQLVAKNILGTGRSHKGSRHFTGYRLHPRLLNGLEVSAAYTGGMKLSPPEPFDENLPMVVEPEEQIPEPPISQLQSIPPVVSPDLNVTQNKDGTVTIETPPSFEDALLKQASEKEDLIKKLVDMYILDKKYGELAKIVMEARDVKKCEELLRRVAELSASGAK